MEKCTLLVWAAFVGWILTVIGWFVHNLYSNSRETRKEIRAEIDKLNDEVGNLLKSSHAYYCSSKKSEQKIAESEILASFNKLGGIVERLERIDPEIKLQKKLDDLYEAVTGGDFGSDRVNRNGDIYTEKCQRLALLSENIRTASEKWFSESYQ